MENKELYKVELGREKITDVIVTDELVTIKYGTDEVSIESYHDQDCCESVYADFEVLKYHTKDIIGHSPDNLILKGVPEMGFLLCIAKEKIFIPCYNCQNGYYSSDLALKIKKGIETTEIDISDFVEDDIN